MAQLFVSYTRRDSDFVRDFVPGLERFFSHVWYDKKRLNAGDSFDAEIENNIKRSQAMILILSPNLIESNYVLTKEIPAAIEANIPIIPYLYKPLPTDVPDVISLITRKMHYINHREDTAFEQLLKACYRAAPLARLHPGELLLKRAPIYDDANPQETLENLGNRRSLTFSRLAKDREGIFKTNVEQGNDDIEIVGIPLQLTLYHTALWFGKSSDTVERASHVQLVYQLTEALMDKSFARETAEWFINKGERLNMVLIRNIKSPTHPGSYGYSKNKDEWSDLITITEDVLRGIDLTDRHPCLHLMVNGPALMLYELGARLKDMYPIKLYQYERKEQEYFEIYQRGE
jgi:hypothetical protein